MTMPLPLRSFFFVLIAVVVVHLSSAGYLGTTMGGQVMNVSYFSNVSRLFHGTENCTWCGKEKEYRPIQLGGFGIKKNNDRASKQTFRVQLTRSSSARHIFTGPVSLGMPNDAGLFDQKQTPSFKMIFDTASSDMLVMGHLMENSEKRTHREYLEGSKEAICIRNPRIPGSYYDTSGSGAGIDNKYSDGTSYRGKMATDSISIGALALNGVDFMVVDDMNSAAVCMRGGDYDGILGLSSVGGGTNTATPPPGGGGGVLAQILQRVKKPIFSYYIRPDGIRGEIMFGGVDKKLHSGMTFFPTVKYEKKSVGGKPVSDWRLKFSLLKVGPHSVKHTFHARFESTLKYGIYAPPGGLVVSGIMSNTPGAHRLDDGSVVIECSKRKQLKDLVLVISTSPEDKDGKGGSSGSSGKSVELSFTGMEYFPYRGVGRNKVPGSYCQLFVVDYPIDGYVQPPDGVFALGVPFMKKYYTSFDTRGQIGIGKAK